MMGSDRKSATPARRRRSLAVCAALVLTTSTLSLVQGQTPAKGRWVATWATAVTPRVDAPPPAQNRNVQNAPAALTGTRTPSPSDPQTLPNGEPIPTGGQSAVHFNNQTIRQIVRDAGASEYTWSSIVLGIVKSPAFLRRAAPVATN